MDLLNRFDLFLLRHTQKLSEKYEKKYKVSMLDSLILLLMSLINWYFTYIPLYKKETPGFFDHFFILQCMFLLLFLLLDKKVFQILQFEANTIRRFYYRFIMLLMVIYGSTKSYLSFVPKNYKFSSMEILLVGLPHKLSKFVGSNLLEHSFQIVILLVVYLLISVLKFPAKKM